MPPQSWGEVVSETAALRSAVFSAADGMSVAQCQERQDRAQGHLAHCRLKQEDYGPQATADAQVQSQAWDDVCWWLGEHGKDTFSRAEWDGGGHVARFVSRLARRKTGGEA